MLETQFEEMLPRRAPELIAEQPRELAGRYSDARRQRRVRLRMLDIQFHVFEHLEKLSVGNAGTFLQCHSLRVIARSQSGVQEPFANGRRQRRSVIEFNDLPHHVERGRATRTCQPIAVDFIEIPGDGESGKFLPQRRLVVPMNRTRRLYKRPARAST